MKTSCCLYRSVFVVLLGCVTAGAAEPGELRQLPVIEADVTTFKPYGQLIETHQSDPKMLAGWIPSAGTYLIEGETAICVWSKTRHNQPLARMERHLKTPEIYIAVEGDFIFPITKPMPLDDVDLHPSARTWLVFM